MLLKLLLVALVGGALALDRTAAFQLMVSRPLVASPLIGWLLGDLATGLKVGALIELVWIARLPLGAALAPNEALAGVVAPALVLLPEPEVGPASSPSIVVAILFALMVGGLTARLDGLIRRVNILLAHWADRKVEEGRIEGVEDINLMGLIVSYGSYFWALLASLAVGVYLLRWMNPLLTQGAGPSWDMNLFIFPLVGISAVLALINVRWKLPLFSLSFTLGGFFLWLLLG